MSKVMQTEFEFSLPLGYVDDTGTRHRDGLMRLATAADEILPMKDPRIQSNPAYLTIILLARVVSKLGTLKNVNTHVIESLYSQDFAYLQDLYNRINQTGTNALSVACPKCEHQFDVEVPSSGEV